MDKKSVIQMPGNSPLFKWHLNSGQSVRYSNGGLNNGPFDDRTVCVHLNTGLVRYSDPHCSPLSRSLMNSGLKCAT